MSRSGISSPGEFLLHDPMTLPISCTVSCLLIVGLLPRLYTAPYVGLGLVQTVQDKSQAIMTSTLDVLKCAKYFFILGIKSAQISK